MTELTGIQASKKCLSCPTEDLLFISVIRSSYSYPSIEYRLATNADKSKPCSVPLQYVSEIVVDTCRKNMFSQIQLHILSKKNRFINKSPRGECLILYYYIRGKEMSESNS